MLLGSFCQPGAHLAILNYFPISACSGLLKFDMKKFVNIARLDIGQLFTQTTR